MDKRRNEAEAAAGLASGDAKRLKFSEDVIAYEGLYEQLKKPADADGFLSLPSEIMELTNKPGDILVRDSCKRLFRQIKHRKASFVHVSGNPGTGKSCCIWYFVRELLNDEQMKYIVVQLVVAEDVTFITISPDGEVWSSLSPPTAVLRKAGTWLLVDQRFTGKRTTLKGKTILFASSGQANAAGAAEKTMNETLYTTFYLDAWRPSELLKVFNRQFMLPLGCVLDRVAFSASTPYPPGNFNCDTGGYSAAAHFLGRLYVCGGIVRYFFQDLDTVMGRQVRAVRNYISTGKEEGALDKVFYSRPAHSLRRVDEIVMVSPYVRKVYAATAGLKERESFASLAKKDPRFSSAAGDFFEDYAHLLLSSCGGTFTDINRPNCSVTFKPFNCYTFYGNSNKFNIPPLSASFGIVDAYIPKQGLLLQMSRAKSQKLMDKASFDELVELCKKEMKRGEGDVIIDGVSVDDEPVFIHVMPHDSKGTDSLVRLKEPALEPKMTPKGNKSWHKVALGIPQLTIALPRMTDQGVKKLSPVYEENAEELLTKMQALVESGNPLFGEESEDRCGECGEVNGQVPDDWKWCNECEDWIHAKCWPKCSNVCLTCALLKTR